MHGFWSGGQLLRLLPVPLQSLMERALAGQFDRSLKFGHSSGIWQVNDKGWEDDHDHIDFDVRQIPSTWSQCTPARQFRHLYINTCRRSYSTYDNALLVWCVAGSHRCFL